MFNQNRVESTAALHAYQPLYTRAGPFLLPRKVMRIVLALWISLFTAFCQSQVLVKSEHSIKAGLAEMNQFPKTCIEDCSFILYLDVSKLHFDEMTESGAYIMILGREHEDFFSFGVQANNKTQKPQLVVIDKTEGPDKEPIVLAASQLNSWEGFEVSWSEKTLKLENIRSVQKVGYDNTLYSSLEKSGLVYKAELSYEPLGFGYMFMGVDVDLWIDVKSQTYNSHWLEMHGGN